jgi:hypothetical protein
MWPFISVWVVCFICQVDTIAGLTPDTPVRVTVLEENVAGALRLLVRPAVHRREVAVELSDPPIEFGSVV